jgi:uncharacterized delta-60 repeat protein
VDTGFPVSGTGADTTIWSVAVQSTNQYILIGGDFNSYNGRVPGRVARLKTDGTLDAAFVVAAGGINGTVYSVAEQSDGRVLIGGNFNTYNSIARGYVARLNADGSLDSGFLATGAGANTQVNSLAIQNDGKVLIGGNFTTYDDGTVHTRRYVARLNTDGSLDGSFLATGAGADGYVRSVVQQSNGMILVGGDFSSYNGTSRGKIARIWD